MRTRRTIIAAAVATAMLIAATAAYAATTYTVTSSAPSNVAGSKAKPAAFTPTVEFKGLDATGLRAPTPDSWKWQWNGVTIDGTGFPTCTLAQIDAAQSDSVCPKGSLVAEGPLEAMLGPEGNTSSNILCTGKSVRFYNAGPKLIAGLLVGPATNCAGVAYLAPFPITLKTSGGSTTTTMVLPKNLSHPLPGVEGSVPSMKLVYKKLSRRSKGKTISYVSSTSCPSKRTLTWTTRDPTGTHVSTADLGKCKR